jgi:hypothetical protein
VCLTLEHFLNYNRNDSKQEINLILRIAIDRFDMPTNLSCDFLTMRAERRWKHIERRAPAISAVRCPNRATFLSTAKIPGTRAGRRLKLNDVESIDQEKM